MGYEVLLRCHSNLQLNCVGNTKWSQSHLVGLVGLLSSLTKHAVRQTPLLRFKLQSKVALQQVVSDCPRCSILQREILGIAWHRGFFFRGGFWPDCYRESTEIDPQAGRRPAGGPILVFSRQHSGKNPARKADFRPGSTIA
jgi:hypothetical protein